MAKTLRKCTLPLLCLILFSFPKSTEAQEDAAKVSLISFLQDLERDFDIKFSYADDDIRMLSVVAPQTEILEDILEDVQKQTQLQIQKLNERYYTITKLSSIAICGIVLDNLRETPLPGQL